MKRESRVDLLWELVYLSRVLYPKTIVKNPGKRLLVLATAKKEKDIQELAQALTESIAKLNQITRLRKGVRVISSSREDNLNALSLIKEQLNPETLIYKGVLESYRAIQKHYREEHFTSIELSYKTHYCKSETNRHLKLLQYYELIERVGGFKNKGYVYCLK